MYDRIYFMSCYKKCFHYRLHFRRCPDTWLLSRYFPYTFNTPRHCLDTQPLSGNWIIFQKLSEYPDTFKNKSRHLLGTKRLCRHLNAFHALPRHPSLSRHLSRLKNICIYACMHACICMYVYMQGDMYIMYVCNVFNVCIQAGMRVYVCMYNNTTILWLHSNFTLCM